MCYEVLLEENDRILRLGWEDTREKAEEKMTNYIINSDRNGDSTDFRIWIQEDAE